MASRCRDKTSPQSASRDFISPASRLHRRWGLRPTATQCRQEGGETKDPVTPAPRWKRLLLSEISCGASCFASLLGAQLGRGVGAGEPCRLPGSCHALGSHHQQDPRPLKTASCTPDLTRLLSKHKHVLRKCTERIGNYKILQGLEVLELLRNGTSGEETRAMTNKFEYKVQLL